MMLITNANAHHVSPTNNNNASHANAWPALFVFFIFLYFWILIMFLKIVINLLKDDASHDNNAGHANMAGTFVFFLNSNYF